MRKAAKQILCLAAALVAVCVVCRLAFFREFNLYVPRQGPMGTAEWLPEDAPVVAENTEVLRPGKPESNERYIRIPVDPQKKGETDLQIGAGEDKIYHVLKVDRFRTVYDLNTGNFTGDTVVLVAVTVFWLLVCAIMVWHFFRQTKSTAFYDYSTIYYVGFGVFALATGLVMVSVTAAHIMRPEEYSMFSAYSAISQASIRYMELTTPFMLVFALAMAVSNIELLRHEGFRKTNVLALGVSLLLILGEAVGWYLFTRNFMGSEWEGRVRNTLVNTYATVFVYFQCMLMGAVTCGLLAARHRPDPDKDFIIILGCWFRKDGTLPPLLRGRVDKALEFWRGQKKKTGREARFIPSGGQGENETMPEAEAIRQYLLQEGIDDRLILKEDASKNTWQNMTNSKGIIQETGGGKTIFATTNYHVFRSGLWARQAGLNAEGIGSKTKWWFWPNAFMRETMGLLQKRWKQEILLLIVLIVFFGVLSLIL